MKAVFSLLVLFAASIVLAIDSTSFAPHVAVPTSSGQVALEFGDLDGDGRLDAVAANYWSASITVFRNVGLTGTLSAATFAPPVTLTVGATPIHIRLVDLDGDGRLDLATINQGNDSISIYRNISSPGALGSNSFAARVDLATPADPRWLAAADLNGDGKPDLVSATFNSGKLSLFENTSTVGALSFGVRQDLTPSSSTPFVEIADMDGDGKPDVIVGFASISAVAVYRSAYGGGALGWEAFESPVSFVTGSGSSVTIGDLDGDGKPDIIAPGAFDNTLSVLRNTSTSGMIATNSFAPRVVFGTGSYPYNAVLGDLDGDGRLDVVVSESDSHTASVFRNTASVGAFTTASLAPRVPFPTGSGPRIAVVADLDGDGLPDIGTPNVSQSSFSLLRNLGTNSTPPGTNSLAGDFDLGRDFSAVNNPAGVWSFGWKASASGSFGLLTQPLTASFDNGVPAYGWLLAGVGQPAVYANTSSTTGIGAGGQFVMPPGTVWVHPGANGRPENFGVVRFIAPSNGNYQVTAAVQSVYNGNLSRDNEFRVAVNDAQVFVQFLPPNAGTNFSAVVTLNSGEPLDLMVGRGTDGNEYGSALKLSALVSLTTNAPTVITNEPPPPPGTYADFNLGRDFSAINNPAGAWAYGWKAGASGAFGLLTQPLSASFDNGVPAYGWLLAGVGQPAVYANTSSGTGVGAGGQFVMPSGTVWVHPGLNGRPENFGVVRFTAPSNGNYQVTAAVQSVYDGNLSRDNEFRVAVNDAQIFARFLSPNTGTNFSAVVALNSGESLDLMVGRGADGSEYGSALKLSAEIAVTTNAPTVITNEPPPPPPGSFADFNLGRDFLASDNPAGNWSLGWKGTPTGSFNILSQPWAATFENGVAVHGWILPVYAQPAAYVNQSGSTGVGAGGQFVVPSGTAWVHPGANGRPENLGAVRFTAPSNSNYRVEASAQAIYTGYLSGDTDFHIAQGTNELFSQFLPPHTGTGFTNIVTLAEGEALDFAVGRGLDGNEYGSGLKLGLVITPTTNDAISITNPPPPPPPMVYPDFNAARDFMASVNPAGTWSYGWKGTLGGVFTLDPIFFGASSDNGVAVSGWAANHVGLPALYCNTNSTTAIIGGGQGILPPGTMWLHPGADGRPENFGALRFTSPSNANYRLETAVASLYSGGLSGDTDFHVVVNGIEVFGQPLPATAGTGFTNILALAAGDTVDFAIGRGPDSQGYGAGLKILAVITPTTNAPTEVTNPPPTAPVFLSQPPATISVNAGAGVTLAVTVSGTAPLTYQWLFNGTPISGATTPILNILSAQANDAGAYHVVVSNTVGIVTNSGTVLSITPFNVGTVIFANQSSNRVYDIGGESFVPAGGTLVAGFYAAVGGGDLIQVGGSAPFGVAGRFNGGTRQIPGTTAGQVISLQVRVWDTASGATYETATSGKRGSSPVFLATLGGGASPPSPFWGMAGFSLSLPGLDAAPARVINFAPPTLRQLTRTAAGWAFMVNGSAGATYVIESSVDLIHWKAIAYVVPNENGVVEFIHNDTTASKNFYRARLDTQ